MEVFISKHCLKMFLHKVNKNYLESEGEKMSKLLNFCPIFMSYHAYINLLFVCTVILMQHSKHFSCINFQWQNIMELIGFYFIQEIYCVRLRKYNHNRLSLWNGSFHIQTLFENVFA